MIVGGNRKLARVQGRGGVTELQRWAVKGFTLAAVMLITALCQ